jgi:hypothetical protein
MAWGARNAQPKATEVLQLCEALLSERVEVSGTRIAGQLIAAYRTLDDAGRDAFFDLLRNSFLPDPAEASTAAEAYRLAPTPETLLRLQRAAEPLRQELFRRLNLTSGGTRTPPLRAAERPVRRQPAPVDAGSRPRGNGEVQHRRRHPLGTAERNAYYNGTEKGRAAVRGANEYAAKLMQRYPGCTRSCGCGTTTSRTPASRGRLPR